MTAKILNGRECMQMSVEIAEKDYFSAETSLRFFTSSITRAAT